MTNYFCLNYNSNSSNSSQSEYNHKYYCMDNRFASGASSGVENGGMFTRERIQQLVQ